MSLLVAILFALMSLLVAVGVSYFVADRYFRHYWHRGD